MTISATIVALPAGGASMTKGGRICAASRATFMATSRAEDLVEQLSGVSYVQNNIRVRGNGGGGTTFGAASVAGENRTA